MTITSIGSGSPTQSSSPSSMRSSIDMERSKIEEEISRIETHRSTVETERSWIEGERSRIRAERLRIEVDRLRIGTKRPLINTESSLIETLRSRIETERSRLESEKLRIKSEKSRIETEKAIIKVERSMIEANMSRIETGNLKVYLLYSHDGLSDAIGYTLYTLDVQAIGDETETLTPVLKLPSDQYPRLMGAFAVGSIIYLVGGVVEIGKEIQSPPTSYPNWNIQTGRLSESVYICDTAATTNSTLSVVEGPPMNGGKFEPFVIPINGMVYVVSCMPWTSVDNEGTVLFEVFDPKEGKWSSLPNPPFYSHSVNDDDDDWIGHEDGRIESHVVVDSRIFFDTSVETHIYAFHIDDLRWERFTIGDHFANRRVERFPFSGVRMMISDSQWIARSFSTCESLLETLSLISNLGLVGRAVEDLGAISTDNPPITYGVHYELLDSKNGWFCLLKLGSRDKFGSRENPYVLASIFHVAKKHVDKVCFREVNPWPPHKKLDEKLFDVEEIIGDVEVLGAVDLRCSLFAMGGSEFNQTSCLLAAFLI